MKPPSIVILTVSEGGRENDCEKENMSLSLFYVSLVPHDLSSCHFSLLVPLPPSPQPNGRFELNQKICLSASAYHPEMWQASWGSKKH